MQDLKQKSFNEWLVIRCQQRDAEAFKTLVSNWQNRYYLYALNRLGDKEVAKDVTQECLISISRSIGKLSDPRAYPKWSFRILERRCVDSLRKTIREREVFQQEEELPEIAVSDNKEDKLTVEELLASLDGRIAVVLRLYYLEGLSIDEIAEVKKVPRGTIKSRLYYARKLLAKTLEE